MFQECITTQIPQVTYLPQRLDARLENVQITVSMRHVVRSPEVCVNRPKTLDGIK